jgi:hypothetical protein
LADRLTRLEARVEDLAEVCQTLARRIEALEARLGATPAEASALPGQPSQEASPAVAPALPGRLGVLVGRSFVVLGGAFYLRALTDGGQISRPLGVGLGVLYALASLFLANRAAAHGHSRSAAWHALTACVIGFPLVFEAATSFAVLTDVSAAALLAGFTAFGLYIAWRRGARLVAAVTLGFSLLVGVALLVELRAIVPFGLHLVGTATAGHLLVHQHGWAGLAWPGVALTDLLMAGMVYVVQTEARSWLAPEAVLVVAVAVATAALATAVARHVLGRHPASILDIGHLLAAFLVGFGGAAWLSERFGLAPVFAALALIVSGLAFLVATARLSQSPAENSSYHLYMGLAALAWSIGAARLPGPTTATVLLVAAAFGGVWLGSTASRAPLRLYSAGLLLVAVVASGLLAATADAFLAGAAAAWRRIEPAGWVALLGATGAWILARERSTPEIPAWLRIWPQRVMAAAAIAGLGAAIVALLAGPVAHAGTGAGDAGALAVVRTAVLAGSAIGLALAGRLPAWPELRPLASTALIVGLAKLVFEDLPHGRPGTLFLSFALLGAALIATASLRRRDHVTAPEEVPDSASIPATPAVEDRPAQPAAVSIGEPKGTS